jgi:hypothetical protein
MFNGEVRRKSKEKEVAIVRTVVGFLVRVVMNKAEMKKAGFFSDFSQTQYNTFGPFFDGT